MAEDKQTAADAEGPRWDREEVHGRNCFTMANSRGARRREHEKDSSQLAALTERRNNSFP